MKLLEKVSLHTKIFGVGAIVICLIFLPVLVRAKEQPKRIVSLAPSITESLYYLGLEEELIAVTTYCNYPEQAKQKEIIGSLVNPNVEKIYSLSPDLVLAVNGINRQQTIEKLKSLRIEVAVLNECNSFDDIRKNFIQLGRLTARAEKAKEIVKEVEAEVKFIRQKLKASPPARVFWEVGARPLVSAGAKSFADEFIRYSGGINIFADSSLRYPRVSREEVLKRNPQAIILVTMGDVTEKEKAYWQRFKDLEAVKNNRIYIVNADKVCRPTPLSFLMGLKEVAGLLHPEAFENVE